MPQKSPDVLMPNINRSIDPLLESLYPLTVSVIFQIAAHRKPRAGFGNKFTKQFSGYTTAFPVILSNKSDSLAVWQIGIKCNNRNSFPS